MNTIVHLGLGSFHRAHQAVYLNRLIESGDTGWQIVAGNIRPDGAAVIDALQRQHGEYTVETVTPQGERRYERIRAIREVAALPRLVDVGAADATRIVSFTVTEAGYFLDGAGRLDLSGVDPATTVYGAVAAILRRRSAPVTLLNCDNLRSNGERFRSGLLQFLQDEPALADWVRANTTCPSAMVDRITPRPPADLATRVRAATGFDDAAPVMAESFIQWVIEDDFIAGRPAWERVGVEMVGSVHAHEEAKIRILNASHSCIAWAGTLRGLQAIHEGTAVPAIRQMAHDYVTDDVIPCLTAERPSPIDLAAYRDVVLDRFGNAYVRDTNQRVAMDGYSKIPGFIVPTLRECLARGAPVASTAMLPALFFAFLGRWHRGRLPYTYEDGVMDPAAAHALFAQPDPLAAYCRDPVLWGPLAGNPALHAAVAAAHRRVQQFEAGAA